MKQATTSYPPIPRRAIDLLRTLEGRVLARATLLRYWEYLPEDDRQRLGGDIELAHATHHNAARMYRELRGVSVDRSYLEVALLTNHVTQQDYDWLLRVLGESSDEVEAVIDRAVTDGHLVLVEQPHAAYWFSEQIDIEWDRHQAHWNYLWQLARRSKVGATLDCSAFGEKRTGKHLARLKSSIINKVEGFPIDLYNLIVSAGVGTQRLDLDRARIRIFQTDHAGNHSEVCE